MPTIKQMTDVHAKLSATYRKLYPEPPSKKWWQYLSFPHWSECYMGFEEYKMLAQIGDLSRGVEAMRNGLSPGTEALWAYDEYGPPPSARGG